MTLTSFKPSWWLKNRHLQTLFPVLFPRNIKLTLLRETLLLSDGDFIFLDWSKNKDEDKPILVLLHGLNGSSHSGYIKGIMRKSIEQGFRSVCMNFRSCGHDIPLGPQDAKLSNGSCRLRANCAPERSHKSLASATRSAFRSRILRSERYSKTLVKKGYHAGETQDLNECLNHLFANSSKNTPIFVVGYSLGGNVLLKWLGENPAHPRIHGAVAVSVPFNLARSADQLNSGFSRLYQVWLLKGLRKAVLKNIQCSNPVSQYKKALNRMKTFWEFDDKVTAPMHGFLNVHDYYARSSSASYLGKIKTKTLIIQAEDDPFSSKEAIPNSLDLPAKVKLEILPHGGHVGFIEGKMPFFPKFYLEKRIIHYLLHE